MNNQKEIISLIKSLSGQANILTIPRIYIDIAGDHTAALFLSQCVYWSDRGRDGWFYKSEQEWYDELGISSYQIRRIRTQLKPYIETKLKKANGAPTMHYRVNIGLLTNSIIEKLNNPLLRNSTFDSEETKESDSEETKGSLTETTQEITTEITTDIDKSFSLLSSTFWTLTGIPEPAPGGRGWADWEDGINQLIKINATPEEMKTAKKILDDGKYKCLRPGALVKTIVNMREDKTTKTNTQKVGGQIVE